MSEFELLPQSSPRPNTTMTVDKFSSGTNEAGLPRIPLNLREHRVAIAIQWSIIVFTSSMLPIIGYFSLHYGTGVPLNIVFSPWLGLMGAVSLFSLCKRSWFLLKKNSTCRPLGVNQGWKLDYFGWNFLFGFFGITCLISSGIAFESLIAVSLPLSVLIFYVCVELLLAQLGLAAGIRAPFRFSSVARGEPLRPGVYFIVEDVVAVDGEQGQAFRQAWSDRYEASPVLQSHLRRVSLIWATTGLAIVAVVLGCVFGVPNPEVGYAIGWGLPWVWAGIMAIVTTQMTKSMLRREAEMQRPDASA